MKRVSKGKYSMNKFDIFLFVLAFVLMAATILFLFLDAMGMVPCEWKNSVLCYGGVTYHSNIPVREVYFN